MKRKFLAVLTSVICLAAAVPSTSVYADGRKVLTLGADLVRLYLKELGLRSAPLPFYI